MIALAVGTRGDSEAIQIFKKLTVASGFGFLKTQTPRDALQVLKAKPTLGSRRMLILLSTRRSDRNIPEIIAAFRRARKTSEIIVYADYAHWSGELAISCLNAGARDFLVQGIHDGRLLKRQIGRALQGRSAYQRFDLEIATGKVFVVMPYSLESLDDYMTGISPALRSLGMDPFLSTEGRDSGPLLKSLQRQMQETELVIANISRYGRSDSPNVALEIGFATRLSKPFMVIQRAEDEAISPSMELECLRYHSSADLAAQLYFGLRDCMVQPKSEPFRDAQKNFEQEYFHNLLTLAKGDTTKAAKLSGLDQTALQAHLRRLRGLKD
jgi:DNA-binding NtrC family response regulator